MEKSFLLLKFLKVGQVHMLSVMKNTGGSIQEIHPVNIHLMLQRLNLHLFYLNRLLIEFNYLDKLV